MVDLALYHPELGFYATGGGAGDDRRDFLTSPEVGPLFGAVLGRALDSWWDGLGRPDPFVVVEAGAGSGALAASILAARPECAPALRYVLVERSPVWRERQARRLPLEPPGLVLGPSMVGTDPDDEPTAVPGTGPMATALAELPAGKFTGVVVANELLDNLAFRLLERGPDGWLEVRVGEDLGEVLVGAPEDVAAEAERLVGGPVRVGARVPIQHQARAWVRQAAGLLERGRVVAVDYADTTPSMAERPWTDWVRTYRSHGRGSAPLDDLGAQDVTCEVAVDQVAPDRDRPQAEFLRAHGLDALVESARAEWQERAHLGDLAALQAKSRLTEAAALTDPGGLGGFRVLEWAVGSVL